jgi:hypothetical protein
MMVLPGHRPETAYLPEEPFHDGLAAAVVLPQEPAPDDLSVGSLINDSGEDYPLDVLLQQIDRHCQEHDILHQKRNIAGHRRKAAECDVE